MKMKTFVINERYGEQRRGEYITSGRWGKEMTK